MKAFIFILALFIATRSWAGSDERFGAIEERVFGTNAVPVLSAMRAPAENGPEDAFQNGILDYHIGNLVTNGVPLLSALRLLVRGTANQFFRARLSQVIDSVGSGETLSTSLRRAGGFTELRRGVHVDCIACPVSMA